MKKYIVLSLFLLSASLSYADAPNLALANIRQIGMGSAGVAVNNGDANLYQNPALLSQVKDPALKFPRLQLSVGQDMVNYADSINQLKDSSSVEDTTGLLGDITPMKIAVGAGASTLLSYISPGFGIGIFSGTFLQGALDYPARPTLKATGVGDIAPVIGFSTGAEIFGQKMDLGISAKYIMRNTLYNNETGDDYVELGTGELTYAINHDELTDKLSHTYSSTGYGVDLGMVMPFTVLGPEGKLGLAVRNIGSTLTGQKTLTGNITQDSTQTLPVTTVMGISYVQGVPFLGDFLMAADYKFAPASTFFKSLSMGLEKQIFGDFLKVRGGINQGYIVGGVGLDLVIFHLDYAYQVIELGTDAGQDPLAYHVVEIGILF